MIKNDLNLLVEKVIAGEEISWQDISKFDGQTHDEVLKNMLIIMIEETAKMRKFLLALQEM